MKPETQLLEEYLKNLPELSYNALPIMQISSKIFSQDDSQLEIVSKAFRFVRDEISHRWDIQATEVTKTAVEVLQQGHGICYAKANLLAALLRGQGIPTGFLYQKLLLTDELDGKYCIHALNTVFLSFVNQWVKLDARGNKDGIYADFSLEQESLAFYPNTALGEKNYELIFSQPNTQTMAVLDKSKDAIAMYLNDLPEELEY